MVGRKGDSVGDRVFFFLLPGFSTKTVELGTPYYDPLTKDPEAQTVFIGNIFHLERLHVTSQLYSPYFLVARAGLSQVT